MLPTFLLIKSQLRHLSGRTAVDSTAVGACIFLSLLFSGAENMLHSIIQAGSIHGAKTVTCTASVHSKFLSHLQHLISFCIECEALWEPSPIKYPGVLHDSEKWPSNFCCSISCLFWIFLMFRIAVPHSVLSVPVVENENCAILIISVGSYFGKHLLLHCILSGRSTETTLMNREVNCPVSAVLSRLGLYFGIYW
jgi:Ni/Fe-hydrogenase subunit HybB-like protein